MNHRILLIDSLRGLSAIAVVLFHLNEVSANTQSSEILQIWKEIWRWGYLGVAVFFVLSGYCIAQSWVKHDSFKQFAYKRVKRIYPAYWASVVLVLALVLVVKLIMGVNDVTELPEGLWGWVHTLVLTTSPVTDFTTMNWVYWSLSYEIFFYLILSFVLVVRQVQLRLLLLLFLHMFFSGAAVMMPHQLDSTLLFFVQYWHLFAFGMIYFLKEKQFPYANYFILTSVIQVLLLAVSGHTNLYYLITGILTVGVLIAGSKLSLGLKLLGRIGTVSYSLYLIHVPVGVYVLYRRYDEAVLSGFSAIVYQLVCVVLLVLFSIGFYRFFEKPFMTTTGKSKSV